MKNAVSSFIVLFLIGVQATAATDSVAITGSVAIIGSVQKPGEWTVARIKSELTADVTTISYAGHDGKKHTAVSVPLLSVLRASGLQAKLKSDPTAHPKSKHFELRLVVAVKGRDGYISAFSLAELQPDVGDRHVWLALDTDGQPLTDSDGPLKLLATDDQKPARWVHGIQSIDVIDIAAATTRPTP